MVVISPRSIGGTLGGLEALKGGIRADLEEGGRVSQPV
jgi:hypothetical protein